MKWPRSVLMVWIFALLVSRPGAEASPGFRWPGQSYALLIGTNEYDHWPDLGNPVLDVQTLGEELREGYDFEVEILENPTRAEIELKLREYHQRSFAPADQLLIFFAGHGTFDETAGIGYLVARDSQTREADPIYQTYLPYTSLLPLVDRLPAKHVLLMVDACFAGTLDRSRDRGPGPYAPPTTPELISRRLQFRTRRYITSGGKEYVPDGRPGQHSPFTRRLLEGLRSYGGEDGILSVDELENHLVRVKPQPRWNEFESNDPDSTFYFFANPTLVPRPAVPASSMAEMDPGGSAAARGPRIPPRETVEPLGPGSLDLRSDAARLRSEEVEKSIVRLGLRDSSWNPNGGIPQDFETRTVELDDVVRDWTTGLMWQQGGSSERLTWDEARDWIVDLNERGYAGYHDWRLPTVEEMASLIEPTAGGEGLYIDAAFDPEQVECWTADTHAETGEPWHVRFQKGHIRSYSKDKVFFVRLVRRPES